MWEASSGGHELQDKTSLIEVEVAMVVVTATAVVVRVVLRLQSLAAVS